MNIYMIVILLCIGSLGGSIQATEKSEWLVNAAFYILGLKKTALSEGNKDQEVVWWNRLKGSRFAEPIEEIKKLTLAHQASINLPDAQGDTVVHYSARNYWWELIEFFLQQGASVNTPNNQGDTPLHYAVVPPEHCDSRNNEHYKFVKFLVGKGANVNAVNNEGNTPLHIAWRTNNTATAHALVGSNADITYRNKKNMTPLQYASRVSYEHMYFKDSQLIVECSSIKYMLENGEMAHLNAVDDQGQTLLHWLASQKIRKMTVEYATTWLIHKGIDTEIKDKHGLTAQDYALKNGYTLYDERYLHPIED